MGHVRSGVTALAVAAGLGLVAACAAGEEDAIGNVPVAKKEETATSTTLPPPSSSSGGDDGSAPPDPGGDGGADATVTTDTGAPLSCAPATNTCINAIDLGVVRADEGADVATRTGSATTWFKLRAKENDTGGPGGKRMKIRATLTSPPGANFDLFVHLAGDGSSTNCTSASASSTTGNASEQAQVEWGESNLFNGDVDDRWVTIEVRYISGTCSPASNFTLTVNRW